MPKMVVTHAVVDIERWLQGKQSEWTASANGATNVTDYVAADGSNNVAVTADIRDMAGLQAAPQRSATASSNRSLRTSRSSPGTAFFGFKKGGKPRPEGAQPP